MNDETMTPASDLLCELRRVSNYDSSILESIARRLSVAESASLAAQLNRVVACLSGRHPVVRDRPPDLSVSEIAEEMTVTAQLSAVAVAQIFVRSVVHKWACPHLVVAVERAAVDLVHELVLTDRALAYPGTVLLRLRRLEHRLVVEAHAMTVADPNFSQPGSLITARVAAMSRRCGEYVAFGHTVVWCELDATDAADRS
ncbi:hypothetical protein ACWCW7_33705 [Nocardia tengchongensis]